MDFILHIGLPKTATTTLQNSLFLNHPEIFYLGKSKSFGSKSQCATDEIDDALDPILWHLKRDLDVASIRERIFGSPVFNGTKHHVVLTSWEGLASEGVTGRFAERLRRARQVFEHCRMLVTLRHPVHWAASEYLQHLVGHYTSRNRPHMGRHAFVEFDEWYRRLAERRASPHPFLFCQNIRVATEMLGADNVGIFQFEDFVADPVAFGEAMCRFMRIDCKPVAGLLASQHLNPRITESQLALMRRTQHSPLRRLGWMLSSEGQRVRRLERARADSSGNERPARIALSTQQIERINRDTSGFFRWVAEDFGLDLQRHGYPM